MRRLPNLVWLLACLLVFGVAVFLRLDGLGEPSLWFDEILHLERGRAALEEPWSAWISGLRVDRENGPLYYATQLLAMRFTDGEVAARLAPALLGVLTVIVMGWLGWAAAGQRCTAVVAASLLAVSPLHVYLSREGRPYAAVMLMASLLLLLLLAGDRRWAAPAAYVGSIVTAFLGAVAAPVLISFALLSLTDWIAWRRPRTWWPGHFLIASLLGISITILIFPTAERLGSSRIPPDFIVTDPLSLTAMDRLLASLTVSGVDWAASRPSSWILLGLAGWGAIFQLQRHRRVALNIIGMFALPVVGWLALLTLLDRWYLVRYTSAGLPAFLLLVSIGLVSSLSAVWNRLPGSTRRPASTLCLITLLVVAIVSASNWSTTRTEPWQKADWRALADLIAVLSVDHEPVIAHSDWSAISVRHYLEEAGRTMEVLNAGNDLTTARRLAGDRNGAWVLSAGYERATEFRAWMQTLDPVFRGELANMALFYSPDFSAFVGAPGRASALGRLLQSRGEPLNRLEFSSSELLLGTGWSYPEVSGDGTKFRWAAAETAEVGFLSRSSGPATLRLRLLPFPSAQALPQGMNIQLNGQPLQHLQLQVGWSEYDIPLAAHLWRRGPNVLTFRFDWLQSPADLDSGSADTRSLAAAFDFAAILDEGLAR
jgi:mannosyltransferase